MIIYGLFFYIYAFLLVVSSILVISVKNPVHSVLWLIFAFFNAAGLFILIGAEFIAMSLIIVYVGAVAVLFLFVVMMLNVNFEKLKAGFNQHLPIYILIALILLADLFMVIYRSNEANAAIVLSEPMANLTKLSNSHAIGQVLYTKYMSIFLISGVVLLVAMIGAIVLTHRRRENVKSQSAARQFSRTVKDSMEVINVEKGKGVVR